MNQSNADARLTALLEEIDLPERAYELAERRYEDLAKWIARAESELAAYDAHIFVQGSFAFGTVVRPINEGDEYDLDFSCKLRQGVSRQSHTQKQLKAMLGRELERYRAARQIQKHLEEKNRCWRLRYRDELPFHMDVVPGIRADDKRRRVLQERMELAGLAATLAQEAARRALWISDLKHPDYSILSSDWPSSNPGGYQLWFRSRMRSLQKDVLVEAQVDPVPVYRSKTSLQKTVQLLKRHRDVMFKDMPDAKPASIILTTVVGTEYQVGETLSQTMVRALAALELISRSNTDQILNPVNSKENFADRWVRPDCEHLNLKKNFHDWVREACREFSEAMSATTSQRLNEITEDAFAVKLPAETARWLGLSTASSVPRAVTSTDTPPKPWAD